ncbi:DHHC zinc finger membrane protein [Xylona heveae TC161]|uniref:Palmitoyltransferase n=1 Tax=Xylona heveae (strain CBS 132557 / TC161) TaxID=1328760 RepID=A0A165H3Z7_XYLHT|nr:DHHC zinc finger membrane protein [Xylona heveae TC161]KZF22954.1 DHHC zinc finger membrane protein [Xylona heveae TC161]
MAGKAKPLCDQKTANVWVARVIPFILVGIVGYVTWVFVALLCVNYLLHPSPSQSNHGVRRGAAIAGLVLYFILLLSMTLSYFRLVLVVLTNPGYVPRGSRWRKAPKNKSNSGEKNQNHQPETDNGSLRENPQRSWVNQQAESRQVTGHNDGEWSGAMAEDAPTEPQPGLERFYTKNIFLCENDGRPAWCSKCLNWKPDRAHHCSELDRCVRKMDHFCPWVGGIVSETSFKFFIQFVSYATFFCIFVLIFMAYFVAERRRETGYTHANWAVTLGFAGLFGLFAGGMAGTSLHLVFTNSTTIESLTKNVKVWRFAVFIPRPDLLPRRDPAQGSGPGTALDLSTITYPLSPTTGLQVPMADSNSNDSTRGMYGSQPTSPDASVRSPSNTTTTHNPHYNGPPRTFAILRTKPGENPWDLGYYNNFKTVMGNHWYDWFIPVRHSPCTDHESGESAFAVGPIVDRLRAEAGILPSTSPLGGPVNGRKWPQDGHH